VIAVLADSLPLDLPIVDEPAVDAGEQVTPAVVQVRIGAHGFQHTDGWRPVRWLVAKQPSERPLIEVEQLFELGNGGRVRSAASFLPLPHGAWRPPDRLRDGTLRQPGRLAGMAQRSAEPLALLTATVHAARMPDQLSGVQTILSEGLSIQHKADSLESAHGTRRREVRRTAESAR